MCEALIEQLRAESALRKLEHPGWPTHKMIMHLPHSESRIINETTPVGPLKNARGYCKYCYRTHKNWWLMDQRDYQIDHLTIVLCGECEHTSPAEYARIAKRYIPSRKS